MVNATVGKQNLPGWGFKRPFVFVPNFLSHQKPGLVSTCATCETVASSSRSDIEEVWMLPEDGAVCDGMWSKFWVEKLFVVLTFAFVEKWRKTKNLSGG